MPAPTTALKTDHYELTMVAAARRSGVAGRRAVFEVFARSLPRGRRYGVVGGVGRLLDAIEEFRFGSEELEFLADHGVVDDGTLEWLRGYRFGGDVVAYREGELYFPYSPVLTVEATFAEALVLETLVLSILNHDTAVASAAARMVDAAGGRSLLEMGGRRTHEDAAIAAARMAWLVGFDATSNLEAGRRYGIPTRGTAAHAFTLAHGSEPEAFAAQLDCLGVETTLLVDTYDTASAIRTAVELARTRGVPGPGAIRIDSGDLATEAARARALLDELGATGTRIVASGDLDEFAIADLAAQGAAIDGFGIGTRLVTGSGHPTANFVYKLVAIAESDDPAAALRRVAKRSAAKATVGGRKRAWRVLDGGEAVHERVVTSAVPFTLDDEAGAGPGRPLQVLAVEGGKRRHDPGRDEVLAHHRRALDELPARARTTEPGPPAISGAQHP